MSLEKPWQIAICATDTVWGLVCRIDSTEAKDNVARIYAIKQREATKPLILFGSSLEVLRPYAHWNNKALELARKHWPGALTIIMRRSSLIPEWINPGEEFIGLRVPRSPSVMSLLKQTSNGVLLSTSANLSGEAPVANYKEACELARRCEERAGEAIHIQEPDASETASNQASTIVKITDDRLEVLRQGDICVN